MEAILNFIVDNLLYFIIGAVAVVLIVGLIIMIKLVKKAKRRKDSEYEKIAQSAQIISDNIEEDGEATVSRRKGDSDLSWLKDDLSVDTDSYVETVEKSDKPKEENVKLFKKAVGKWIVKEKGEGEFVAYLYANNGEVILTSEIYSTADGAKKGIATIRKNAVKSGEFQIYSDKNGRYYFKLKTSGNRLLCVGETYQAKSLCTKAVESVKRFVDSPIADEVESDITVIKYQPKDEEGKDGYNGKWTILENADGSFVAQLFASNGILLLNSENYQSYASAKAAIQTITNNGLSGNFIIDSDKKGRYFFKLRNGQKTTLCIGETYAELEACQSAVDSVYRFLKTAKLAE